MRHPRRIQILRARHMVSGWHRNYIKAIITGRIKPIQVSPLKLGRMNGRTDIDGLSMGIVYFDEIHTFRRIKEVTEHE